MGCARPVENRAQGGVPVTTSLWVRLLLWATAEVVTMSHGRDFNSIESTTACCAYGYRRKVSTPATSERDGFIVRT